MNEDYRHKPITVRVKDACRMIGISRSKLYLLIANNEIEFVKIGSATLILISSIENFIERNRKKF